MTHHGEEGTPSASRSTSSAPIRLLHEVAYEQSVPLKKTMGIRKFPKTGFFRKQCGGSSWIMVQNLMRMVDVGFSQVAQQVSRQSEHAIVPYVPPSTVGVSDLGSVVAPSALSLRGLRSVALRPSLGCSALSAPSACWKTVLPCPTAVRPRPGPAQHKRCRKKNPKLSRNKFLNKNSTTLFFK